MTAFSQESSTEIFEDMEDMILSIVRSFHSRYGGSIEDLIQDAAVSFLCAAMTHDDRRGVFGKRIRYRIQQDLFEIVRTKARRSTLFYEQNFSDLVTPDSNFDVPDKRTESKFCMADFVDGMSRDAAAVVRIVLESRVVRMPRDASYRYKKPPRVLYTHLRRVGWARDRILSTFNEITEALR